MTTENWFLVLWDGMDAAGGFIGSVYFIILISASNYILVNLFVAIIVGAFSVRSQILKEREKFKRTKAVLATFAAYKKPKVNLTAVSKFAELQMPERLRPFAGKLTFKDRVERFMDFKSDRTFFIFTKNNPVRILCKSLCFDSRKVWYAALVGTVAMCVLLSMQWSRALMHWFSLAYFVYFSAEIFIKVTAGGFYLGGEPKAYLNYSSSNRIDFVMYCGLAASTFLCWLCILVGPLSFYTIEMHTLAVGVLVPVRLLSRGTSRLKVIVKAALLSAREFVTVGTIGFAILWVFALYGHQMFAFNFSQCNDPAFTTRQACEAAPGKFLHPVYDVMVPRRWEKAFHSFDTIADSLLTLYTSANFAGWLDVMYSGMDMTGPDTAPVDYRDKAEPNNFVALFNIIWMCVGGFVILNVFVGAVIDAFLNVHEELSGTGFMTESQKMWNLIRPQLLAAEPFKVPMRFKPSEKLSRFRQALQDLSVNRYFEPAILGVVMANALVMALDRAGNPDWLTDTIGALNVLFVVIFVVEAFIKIVGLRPRYYFSKAWNIFDLSLVVLSVMALGSRRSWPFELQAPNQFS